MEEKAIKILCGWTKLEFNTRTDEKVSFQNLTRHEKFNSKYEAWHFL